LGVPQRKRTRITGVQLDAIVFTGQRQTPHDVADWTPGAT
jgi:hypothetical protein